MLIGHYFNYREFLNDELLRRTQLNRQYSLRAFARDLEMTPQVLSSVMGGKKNISTHSAIEIARRLKLNTEEVSYFHDLVEFSQAKTPALKELIQYRLTRYTENQPYKVLQEDIFKIIADWYHYAILELTFLEDFDRDPKMIAKRLNITPLEARQAIERLLRLELLEDVDGKLQKTDVNLSTTQDLPSAAVRKLASQLLSKASDALEHQSVDERDFGNMTMAIDPKKIPEAKKMIRKFRRELTQFLESGSRKEVYVFATQLFSLSKNIKKDL